MAERITSATVGGLVPVPPTVNRRLPRYFPLVEPKCKEVAAEFFTCFEANSKMQSNTDVTSCKQAVVLCSAKQDAYEQCMNEELRRSEQAKTRPWWKVW